MGGGAGLLHMDHHTQAHELASSEIGLYEFYLHTNTGGLLQGEIPLERQQVLFMTLALWFIHKILMQRMANPIPHPPHWISHR